MKVDFRKTLLRVEIFRAQLDYGIRTLDEVRGEDGHVENGLVDIAPFFLSVVEQDWGAVCLQRVSAKKLCEGFFIRFYAHVIFGDGKSFGDVFSAFENLS